MNPLAPFGKLYGRLMDVRNRLYDRGVLKSYDLGARTISVGNLTTGGTGKTPLVALIAKMLLDDGETVCILTRGYGRRNPASLVLVSDGDSVLVDAATGGDEPVELAQKLDGKAIIVADVNRIAAAKWAREKYDIATFILDDGFQHRRARRDLDIVCIDATSPCGNGRILPAGTLRESFKGLNRTDAIVITRGEQIESTANLEERLRGRNAKAEIFRAKTKIFGLKNIDSNEGGPEGQDKLFAFTGIGNPNNFFISLAKVGFDLTASESFPDHHRFVRSDIENIEAKARASGAAALVTTAKDAVKLYDLNFSIPCYFALAETVIEDTDRFRDLILASKPTA